MTALDRENQRVAISKRLLKESLLRLMEEKDIDKINVTELCREAGINRVTFYRHYDVPRDVLLEIEKDIYYGLKKAVRFPIYPQEIKPCIDKMCAYLEQHRDILRVLIQCNSDTDIAMFVNEIYTEIWNEVSKLDIAKNLNQEEAKLPILFCAGGSYVTLRYWLLGSIPMSAAEMADYVYALIKKTDWVLLGTQLDQLSNQ